MDWGRLLSDERFGARDRRPEPGRSHFVQDHDRIVFSAPFRRLANKTQVQPLYENDHVHHRLIHSVEVSSVGRSLAMGIGQWLVENDHIPRDRVHDLANIVQAACVAHDIGNPPFGHSGEAAMGEWFTEGFDHGKGLLDDLPKKLRPQFTAFEGNAQGFRILTRLEMYRGTGGMQLAKATLGAFTKYPVTAADRLALKGAGFKKYGIFQSDRDAFANVAETLGLPERSKRKARVWGRHPLVYVMEAADDITYNIVDLEDAFTTAELPYETTRDLLFRLIGKEVRPAPEATNAEHIAHLRARSIGAGVAACVDAFATHYAAIMAGTFTGDLVSASTLSDVFRDIKTLSRDQIFTAPRKTELEISGRQIIRNVMSGILPVYAAHLRKPGNMPTHETQLARALSLDLRDVTDAETALHALADFTSGMTDRYALRISRMLTGA
ncbi:MAG: dNTP triphosphohydrolase [Paracoccus sp. (in: a-proteobacteria)]|uniref:dGTP triphosphohydrolase n=1 Tax=Paracoccus sp. TaxID=267 RepID=UPI0026E0ECFF|nr:dNTP triphosphohydrolase [Paracoccus sp. (in: a-proteobacteria)]MDO5620236.1 dNTP triphosphohydrolase [Paracoccus sp. (in: a-proteobacteria)]